MTPADVARLIRTLQAVANAFEDFEDRYEQGIAAGITVAVNALREHMDEA